MESLIILLIGVAIAIIKAKAKNESTRQRTSQPGVPRKTQTTGSMQGAMQSILKTYQNQMSQQRTTGNYQNQTMQQRAAGNYQNHPNQQDATQIYQAQQVERNKQQQLKERLQKQYAGQVSQQPAANHQQNSGYQSNSMEKVQPADSIIERANDNLVEFEGEEQLDVMSQVNDMMIMGYTGELTFERDFISEGIEMLNRYELPDSLDSFKSSCDGMTAGI